MKASALRPHRAPPRVVKLPPTCFVDSWSGRPTSPIPVGLRRASAGETELASKEAVRKTDELFPELIVRHHDPVWKAAYDTALLHILLSYTLTRPDDVDQPLWPKMDGAEWITRLNTSEGLTFARNPSGMAVSRRFTVQGLGRLYDEVNALAVLDNPLYPELDDEQVVDFFAGILDKLADLEGPARADEQELDVDARHGTAAEARRMLGYLVSLVDEGMSRPPTPVVTAKPAGKGSPPRG